MTRPIKKASKKVAKKAAPAPKKAAKAPLRNKTAAAAKKVSPKKVGKTAGKTVNKKASRKAATKAAKPAKAGSRTAPKKKTAKRAASSKKVVKPAVAPRKAKKPAAATKAAAARKTARRVSKAPAVAPRPVEPPKPSKLTPAQIEELRISKERRKAQERQADYYDKASGAFQARHFQRALTLFEKAAEGPDSTLTDRARVHISICQQQVKPLLVKLKTADEFYHYSIRLINERRFDEAGKSLNQALKIQPRGAHIHFAAAVLAALTRDTAGTYKNLKRAIELDPRNRVAALNDTDLAAAAKDPAISQLLHGNSTSSRDR
jgi:tetratricopeptide (TPR) repeat protein